MGVIKNCVDEEVCSLAETAVQLLVDVVYFAGIEGVERVFCFLAGCFDI